MSRKILPCAAFILSMTTTFDHETNAAVPIILSAPIIEVESIYLPPPVSARERDCLARAVYHEARGESVHGQIAVGMTVMNRVYDSRYPGTICSVVNQRIGKSCQFTWACDKKLVASRPKRVEWAHSQNIADLILAEWVSDPTNGATHFHARYVRPLWINGFKRMHVIDNHLFYKRH